MKSLKLSFLIIGILLISGNKLFAQSNPYKGGVINTEPEKEKKKAKVKTNILVKEKEPKRFDGLQLSFNVGASLVSPTFENKKYSSSSAVINSLDSELNTSYGLGVSLNYLKAFAKDKVLVGGRIQGMYKGNYFDTQTGKSDDDTFVRGVADVGIDFILGFPVKDIVSFYLTFGLGTDLYTGQKGADTALDSIFGNATDYYTAVLLDINFGAGLSFALTEQLLINLEYQAGISVYSTNIISFADGSDLTMDEFKNNIMFSLVIRI